MHSWTTYCVRFLICSSLIVPAFLYGQTNSISFEKVTTQMGLSSNKVFMTLEDEKGFIWIATNKGVNRFDGVHIKNCELDRYDEIVSSNFSRLFLAKDSKGTIWVISNRGLLQYFDPGKDRFVFYDYIQPPNGGGGYTGNFYIDHKDQFFIGLAQGVISYHPVDRSYQPLPQVTGQVRTMIQDANQNYYFGSSKGIFIFDKDKTFLQNLEEELAVWPLGGSRIHALYVEEAEKRLWIGTQDKGLFYYHLKDSVVRKASKEWQDLNVPIRSIQAYGEDQLWIGCDGSGVIVWDLKDMKVLKEYLHDADTPHSLGSNSVYSIFVNSQEVIFISTYRGGLNIYNPYKQDFSLLSHAPRQQNSLDNNLIFSILEPQKGLISFSTDNGISQWNKKTNTWQHFSFKEKGNESQSPVVLDQVLDPKGTVWAASFNSSLLYLTQQNAQYVFEKALPEKFKNFRPKRLLLHSDGSLFIGTILNGLWAYQPDEDKLKQYRVEESLSLFELSPTEILIGSQTGISILDLKTDEIHPVANQALRDSLKDKGIVSVLRDKNQHVWLASNAHGVFRVDFQAGTLNRFSETNGLASNKTFSIVEDDMGDIWVATSVGISRITPQGVDNFYQSDGVATTDFNNDAAFKDADGRVYVGSNQGVIYFDPSKIQLQTLDKQVVFTDLFHNHKRVLVEEGSALQRVLDESETLTLTYNQRSFAIAFTSVDFTHVGYGTFQWKLEGFDQEWVDEPDLQRASYTNLSPGTYQFRLRLVDPAGKNLGVERQLAIKIQYPFWMTPIAYLCYAVLIVALILGMLYVNRLILKSKNAKEQLRLLMTMAHEVKTPLTLIRSPLSDLVAKHTFDESVQDHLEVALSNSEKLHKQMMQLLDFRSISAKKQNPNIVRFDLVNVVQEKIFAFKVLADQKDISIRFDPTIMTFEINSDEEVLDKVISNVLSNAIKYTPEGGEIELELDISAKNWSLLVKDTGIGIPKKDQKKVFKLFYRTQNARESGSTGSGVGLILAKDLARTLGGDLTLQHSSPRGSVFKIFMPLISHEVPVASRFRQEVKEVLTKTIEREVSSKTHILIVEDDKDLRNYEKEKLSQHYKVTEARNGQEALKIIEKELPDLIVSDIDMPKMNGLQLCLNIKSSPDRCHIPTILLTGMGNKEHIIQGLAYGADDYIVKPFDFDILLSKIDGILHARQVLKETFMQESKVEEEYESIKNEMDQDFISKVTLLVEDHLNDQKLSGKFLSTSVGMSRSTFYHKLKSLIGVSPGKFIKTIRLREAKKLLQNPRYNISDVAYLSGFMDAKYFSTVFKKHYGKSPSAYLEELERSK